MAKKTYGFTLNRKTIERLEELADYYELSKSGVIEQIVKRQYNALKKAGKLEKEEE